MQLSGKRKRPSGACPSGDGVKGKQVRILYDLVTVFREALSSSMSLHSSCGKAWKEPLICKPGNLPLGGTGEIPGSRVIGRTVPDKKIIEEELS